MDALALASNRTVFADIRANSKKGLFQEVAQRLSLALHVDARDLFSALLERERLGSTGMGRGVAIPHCRLPDVSEIFGAMVRLETPIEFDAIDREPVDLFFFLVAPQSAGSDHLRALARVSRVLRDNAVRERLRGAKTYDALLAALDEFDRPRAA
jgi:PTS system nitrogen regulatory IIA component